jgi:hypothetical protein
MAGLDYAQQQARDRAVHLLQHYVRVLFDKSGHSASYTSDTDAEIAQFVDDVITAASPSSAHHEAVDALIQKGKSGA